MQESKTIGITSQITTQRGTEGTSGLVTTNTFGKFNITFGRTGQENPKWRSQIRNFQNATTSFSGYKVRVKRSAFNFSVLWHPPVGQRNFEAASGHCHIKAVSDPIALSIEVAQQQAQQRVLSEIIRRRSAFQGGTFIAELRSTLRGIRQPLKHVREGLNAYHRRAKMLKGRYSWAKFQQMLAGTWLEFQFGHLQNFRDIESGLENLKQMSKTRALHFRASGEDITLSAPAVPDSCTGFSINSRVEYARRLSGTVLVIYRGAYKVSVPHNWDYESWVLSTQDFIPSIWEAIPYSFAVDYFTNIGRIISAYAFIPADVAWVNKTVRKEYVDQRFGTRLIPGNPPQYPAIVNEGSLGYTTIVSTRVQRSADTPGGLIPTFTFQVPEAGSLKWLNIAALIRLKTL